MKTQAQGHFGMGTLWHGDIMALGHFGTKIFQHMDVSALGNFGTMQSNMDVWAETFILPKYPCAEMYQCRNVPMPKSPCVEKFMCRRRGGHLTSPRQLPGQFMFNAFYSREH